MEIGDLLLSIVLWLMIILQITILVRMLISQYKTDKMKKELYEAMQLSLYQSMSTSATEKSDESDKSDK